ncbi:carbamoyl-phosphate synthase large subunit [Parvibaculum sp.]|jgi:carbamoyl-phosphate synthase large subunit|uniref:carbamoyl-phosphate synthase large subunit n=2 Tax=Parvibaculum sp. TaxID=2024848 RepID=UPI001B226D40|nr:carbamoyl-phosphate synthase large subunit [Parvibaculum sp.]MBO6679700.1 carbamoyl-phosphate synthase large subunit [Parvibaculum sp.]MBO6684691.1 carbamoyl-phosphate synthase large subunit [Parvibaculum sp.]MBO6905411.1 carbamoyl-phosphate synthase large subunit [Parvibaculum sp.]
MPKRTDIKSIMIIGAGPIIIGQACEFDYSGTQACKALKEEGYRIILVNSNPATIMTDPELADATYIEPITPEVVAKIVEKERPDALLPTMGGQTALNTALALADMGVLEKFGVEMIGAKREAIEMAEDRQLFRDAMDRIGLESPRSKLVHNMEEAMEALEATGLPAIIRPSFTMGGTGGGIAYNKQEFADIIESGLDASPVNQVLVEESVLGWKEYEMEVVRDRADNCIIICSIENVDPMGVHTGDSITVAPALTLTDKEYQVMRNASIAVLREIGVETGGSNVQFAVNPKDGRLVVIEMNPRVSRSSALASKATGFPIAKIAAKLAVGYTLDELQNDITKVTPASFEPTIDYVVTKIPRFAFEKFAGAEKLLGTAMKSVGEAMAIGRTFQESLQKALRSMETGLTGLNEVTVPGMGEGDDKNAIRAALGRPTPDRLLVIAQALRHGMSHDQVRASCSYDPWFLEQLQEIVDAEEAVRKNGLPQTKPEMRRLKAMGFSDARLAELAGSEEEAVRKARREMGVRPVYKRIDTCAAEFESLTPYMYSTYETDFDGHADCEADPSDRKKAIILGGGPNRIGQGIEFDYCCCHAAFALDEIGIESIMVNCNPETVSTDYDTSDRLYFEPLTAEDVLELIDLEMSKGTLLGVIVQFGGQTPLKLADDLERAGIPILGTSPDAIDLAEDRDRFSALLGKLGLKQPPNGIARSAAEAKAIAEKIGYPVVIRPSYVLGGRGMEIVRDTAHLERYINEAVIVSGKSPVLIDGYLRDAIEVDVDALCDGKDVVICGIMEHIEEAGVHSGDSACSLPPYSLKPETIAEIERQTRDMALALNVGGLMNVQYAIQDGTIYVLEVNPRASRTVPFVAKVIGEPVAKIAAKVMAGESLASFNLKPNAHGRVAVKEAVFPFARFPGVDTVLGPEMRSTGEVMGLDRSFAVAFAKSQLGGGTKVPTSGTVFVSVKDSDKTKIVAPAKKLLDMGFKLIATGGTQRYLEEQGLKVGTINKVLEGRPHIVDAIKNGEVQLVFNTTEGAQALADSMSLRRAALMMKVPYYTTVAGARAAVEGIDAIRKGQLEVASLQSYI